MAAVENCKNYGLFFGCRNGSQDFASVLCRIGGAGEACNSAGNLNAIKRLPMYQLMLAKNYSVRAPGQGDNDLHEDFVDFVIGVGRYHAQLDVLTGASNVGDILRGYAMGINRALLSPQPNIVTAGKADNQFFAGLKESETVGLINVCIKIFICDIAKQLMDEKKDENKNNISTGSAEKIVKGIIPFINADAANKPGYKFVKLMAELSMSKADYEKLLTSNNIMREAQQSIEKVFGGKLPPCINDEELKKVLINIFTEYFKSVYDTVEKTLIDTCLKQVAGNPNKYELRTPEYKDEEACAPVIKDIFKSLNVTKATATLSDQMYSHIATTVPECINLAGSKGAASPYPTVDSGSASEFIKQLQTLWTNPSTTPSVKDFYRGNLFISSKSDVGPQSIFNTTAGWAHHELDARQGTNTVLDYAASNSLLGKKGTYRVNLKKHLGDAKTTVFEAKLPFVPDSIPKLWWTSTSGLKSMDASPDSLKKLYHEAFTGDLATHGLPNEFNKPNNGFRIINHVFNRNYIQESSEPDPESAAQVGADELGDLWMNTISGAVYQRDEAGLYKVVNGKRGKTYTNTDYLDNDDQNTCYGTRLNQSSFVGTAAEKNAQCVKFVRECLMGSCEDLPAVLEQLKNRDLFKVAKEECANVDPIVALRILRRFCFKQTVDSNGVTVVESYEHWEARHLGSNEGKGLREVLKENVELGQYLKGIIDFVNSNPAILNIKSVTPSEQPYRYNENNMGNLKINYYVEPSRGTPSAALFTAQQMRNTLFVQPPPTPSLNSLVGIAANTLISPGQFYPATSVLTGGGDRVIFASALENYNGDVSRGAVYNSTALELVFDETISILDAHGYKLSQNSRNKIKNEIEKIKKSEAKLRNVHALLKKFADLATFFGASGCAPSASSSSKTFSLECLKSKQDTVDWLHNNINGMYTCMSSSMASQNAHAKNLVESFTKLIESAAGKHDSCRVRVCQADDSGYTNLHDPAKCEPKPETCASK